MREEERVEREELSAKLAQAKCLQAFREWVQQERVRQAEMAAIQQRELEARLVSPRMHTCLPICPLADRGVDEDEGGPRPRP